MGKFLIVIGTMAMLLSCASHQDKSGDSKKSNADSLQKASSVDDYLKADGDSLVIPSFSIEVKLSQQAEAKLAGDKETVIVAAWFSGLPKDTASREYKESGAIFIKSSEIELSNTRIANFEGIKFSKAVYDSLADKDIGILINIFSGRKSSPDNLLDCSILTDKMSAVKGQKFVLTGKLISEADSLVVK